MCHPSLQALVAIPVRPPMKIVRVLSLTWLALTGAWATGEADPGVWIVREGQPRAAIVLPDRENAARREIAAYFSRIVEQSTGAKIPILEESAAKDLPPEMARIVLRGGEDLPPETYRILCRDHTVTISGRDESSDPRASRRKEVSLPTLWAVDRILEKGLGVRWLWPGELGTYVPRAADLFVSEQDTTYQPVLIQRKLRVLLRGATEGRGGAEKHRVEREAIEWVEHHQAGRRGNFKFGHAFADWWGKFSQTHPDYFMVPPPGVDLAKIPPHYIKLRVSNPAVIEEIARQYLAAGAPKYWNVCPNDGSGFDTCEATLAWDLPQGQTVEEIWTGKANLTARYVMFWNRLGERLRQINPEVVLCTYAYSSYRQPPPPERPLTTKLMAGLVLSYHDESLWKGWAETGAELFLRPNWWHVGANAPYLPLAETERFLKMAVAHGMVGIDMDSLMGYWATQGLNYYLVARLMNHPSLTREQILQEYASAFGTGAPKILEYFAYWQKVTSAYRYYAPDGKFQEYLAMGKVDKALSRASRHLLPFLYTDEVLAPGYRLLEEADALLGEEDHEARARVSFLRSGLDEMKATRDLVALSSVIKSAPSPDAKKRFKTQSDALAKLRAELNLRHALWNDVISKDEDRRGVYHIPRLQAPQRPETDEM